MSGPEIPGLAHEGYPLGGEPVHDAAEDFSAQVHRDLGMETRGGDSPADWKVTDGADGGGAADPGAEN